MNGTLMLCRETRRGLRAVIVFAGVMIFLMAASFECGAESGNFELTRDQKVFALNAGAVLIMTTIGVACWDYGQNGMAFENEGWFQEDSKEGGADKLGHFYSTYAISHGFAHIYESWDFSRDEAALYGSLSSFGLMAFAEFGDAFSDYGFSYEDLVMNAVGGCAGYLLYRYPEVARKIDFRLEYVPNFKEMDVFTDYERMKFLVALKLEGFDCIDNNYLGYYVRGYSEDTTDRSRNIYIGVGINLAKILYDLSYRKTSTIFNYYQFPYTYISVDKNINK